MQGEFANKVVIVGASAGGASVAARLRRLDEDAQIVMLDKSAVISFATCGIPYHLGGVIRDEARLKITSPAEFEQLLNVEVRTCSEVTSINRKTKMIVVKDVNSGEIYEEHYHKLVLSPGSIPIRPAFDGVNVDQVFTVRDYHDMIGIKTYIQNNVCQQALIVGGGFIGLEMAENLQHLGMTVTILDKSQQVLSTWDFEMAAMVRRHLRDKQVRLILNDHIVSVVNSDASLASGRSIKADIIILAIGVVPDTHLAQECGLSIGEYGGIAVNQGMVTSDQHIFALGDAVETTIGLLGKKTIVPLAGTTHKQARVVAENLCGRHVNFKEPNSTAIVKVFDKSVAMTGCSEKQLIENNVPYLKSFTESQSNAGYYPGAQSMVIKLLFAEQTGRLLGAQIVGGEGVDKRIDVLATAIHMGMTASQLKDLELAYAPPYSSAKDPVNIAGMVADNMLNGNYHVVHWEELENIDPNDATLIDVRTAEEFELRSLQGAVNIPLEELRDRLDDIPEDKRIIVYCNYGKKGYFAHQMLIHFGFTEVYNISGGLALANHANTSMTTSVGVANPLSTTQLSTESLPLRKTRARHTDTSKVKATRPRSELVQSTSRTGRAKRDESVEAVVLEATSSLTFSTVQPLSVDDVPQTLLNSEVAVIEVDACGLSCPGPIMKLAKTMNEANLGDIVTITATDNGFAADIKTWCLKKGHRLLEFDNTSRTIRAVLIKC